MMAIASAFCRDRTLPRVARRFDRLPDLSQARSLLAELATAPCRFGPAIPDRPLALYGAGDLGRLARDVLAAMGHEFTMVIDRDARAAAARPEWRNVRPLHPTEVPKTSRTAVRVVVAVATAPYVPIERELLHLGFEHIVPFYDLAESFRPEHPLSNGWFAPPLTPDDRQQTAKVLQRWHDDASRAHHLQFLAWRRLREEWAFEHAPVLCGNRFFIPEVVSLLHGGEVLLDAGAYHGDVTLAFIKQTQQSFRQIVAVEPDPRSRAKLKHALRSWLPDQRVSILDCALAATGGEAWFHDGLGYASQLSNTGALRVAVQALDALRLSPSFVKLHLEGGELSALKGARQTLLSNRPLIAATVYHNADGIWRTPLWLMKTLPDYRFLFRLHSWCGTGAVIYAIPNERSRS
jgi:FkbM family methyltransferase